MKNPDSKEKIVLHKLVIKLSASVTIPKKHLYNNCQKQRNIKFYDNEDEIVLVVRDSLLNGIEESKLSKESKKRLGFSQFPKVEKMA